MENRGLLFIPDISGFTKFINETEIEHSRMIIQELLEVLINANQIGLTVSEIEGDAILFYKFGESPDLAALYKQVENMFCAFHRHLIIYEHRRFCQCEACLSAIRLTLKVVTHYGEFTSYNVKQFNKLIGKDVIVAHQLLKNDIDKHEYWLVTEKMNQDPPSLASWMNWNSSAKATESGEIPFHYTQLEQLKFALPADPQLELELTEKSKVASATAEFDTDIITLFHATGDFNYHHRWQPGVKAVEEVDHLLPRIGMRCRHILDTGEVVMYASSYNFNPDRIEFSQTDENKKTSSYFILEKITDDKSKLTIDYYLKKNAVNKLFFNLVKKKKKEMQLEQSLINLAEVIKEIHLKPNVG